MKRTAAGMVLTLMCLLILPLSSVFAVCPPYCSPHSSSRQFAIESMSLTYNKATTFLYVEADHHSRNEKNEEVDHVNKMTVSLNGKIIITLHFNHQKDPDRFSKFVMFKAKAGDAIAVNLFSSGGGTSSLELTVSHENITEIRSVDTQSSEEHGY